ncbi:hypothetical protein B7P43_G17740 [Cryptotermes secundus]|uniref:Uncharacterized protein n=1 Tax=Cryptotermes secundus TaxID=105785 RepID=A0A2J7RKF1_9NEOP|nr:hypothetical protein B7P43_G17740 [Cryptotermes secundus]
MPSLRTCFFIYFLILFKIEGYNFKSIGGGAFIHRGNSANDESNGDGASNLQVSVAALSVYWVVQLVAA